MFTFRIADSSSSLDDSFGSDGQLHERVKDIQILPKTSSPKASDTLKMKEVQLRKSITEKLVSGKTKHATQTITGDTRPGVITNSYLGNCDTIPLINSFRSYLANCKVLSHSVF